MTAMKNKAQKIILFVTCILPFLALAQTTTNFYVVTVEVKSTPNIHGIEQFHWIIPVDSIRTSYDYSISALYINDFSKDKVTDCTAGNAVDVFTATSRSDYSFSDTYKNQLADLANIILSNRKRVQRITKKWGKGKKEVANVYLTPITGNFTFCRTRSLENKNVNYIGTIALPLSDYKSADSFWESYKDASNIDFSKYTFSNKK